LHIDAEQLDSSLPCIAASLGSPKLLVPIKTAAILNHLKPDFDFIKKWSIENQVNGLYVYSADAPSGVDFIARGFNPKGGWNEDAATGVAAGTLISVLPKSTQKDFVIDQGDTMGEPSRISISLAEDDQVLVGGTIYEKH
jgi:PhzF family phenazine biosynthesis protein